MPSYGSFFQKRKSSHDKKKFYKFLNYYFKNAMYMNFVDFLSNTYKSSQDCKAEALQIFKELPLGTAKEIINELNHDLEMTTKSLACIKDPPLFIDEKSKVRLLLDRNHNDVINDVISLRLRKTRLNEILKNLNDTVDMALGTKRSPQNLQV